MDNAKSLPIVTGQIGVLRACKMMLADTEYTYYTEMPKFNLCLSKWLYRSQLIFFLGQVYGVIGFGVFSLDPVLIWTVRKFYHFLIISSCPFFPFQTLTFYSSGKWWKKYSLDMVLWHSPTCPPIYQICQETLGCAHDKARHQNAFYNDKESNAMYGCVDWFGLAPEVGW